MASNLAAHFRNSAASSALKKGHGVLFAQGDLRLLDREAFSGQRCGQSIYNYNRRSALITDVLRGLFGILAFNFCDNKFGFEGAETIESAFLLVQKVHWWLGARFDQEKLQFSGQPVILGVTYDLEGLILKIKQDLGCLPPP